MRSCKQCFITLTLILGCVAELRILHARATVGASLSTAHYIKVTDGMRDDLCLWLDFLIYLQVDY